MIDINIDPYLLTFGSFTLSWHGFFSFVAVATAVFLVARWAPREGIVPDVVYSTAIWAIIGGIVGARLVHVIDQWSFYQDNPGQILAVWRGGVAIFGAILGGFIGGVAYANLAKHPVGKLADLTAPAMLIVQAIGRLGDIINGEHPGKTTSFFWGIEYQHPSSPAFGSPAQHPIIVFEIIWDMIALVIVWKLRGRLKPDGMLFALYLALYSFGRFLITFAREDKVWAVGLTEAQFIALIVMAITIPLLAFRGRLVGREKPVPAVEQAGGTRPRARRRRRRA